MINKIVAIFSFIAITLQRKFFVQVPKRKLAFVSKSYGPLKRVPDFETEWVTGRGEIIKYTELHTAHLINTIKYVMRKAGIDMVEQVAMTVGNADLDNAEQRIIQCMAEHNYQIINFAHMGYGPLVAEYGRRGLDLNELYKYETDVLCSVVTHAKLFIATYHVQQLRQALGLTREFGDKVHSDLANMTLDGISVFNSAERAELNRRAEYAFIYDNLDDDIGDDNGDAQALGLKFQYATDQSDVGQ